MQFLSKSVIQSVIYACFYDYAGQEAKYNQMNDIFLDFIKKLVTEA